MLGGAFGCLGLLVRQRWAYTLMLLSLAGSVVQDAALFGMHGALSSPGVVPVLLQGVVLLAGIALAALARHAVRDGWIR